MLKNLQNNIVALGRKQRPDFLGGFVISLAVAGSAALLAFIFLCVTGIRVAVDRAWPGFRRVSPWPASSY